MKREVLLKLTAIIACILLCATTTAAEEDPVSEIGLDYYSQGGVVVDGVAYFTANDYSHLPGVKTSDAFPHVVAFDVNTFRKLRAYLFAKTYDSSPLVFEKKDGKWLVIAHEHKKERTAAFNRDTLKPEWTSEANQPGSMFFGFSYYNRPDGSKLIFVSCRNGLHAMSGETGRDVWWVKQTGRGGVTPCVDQHNGWVFYQCDGKLLKIRAGDGEILKEIEVAAPNMCVSWNTVLVNDRHGYFVATRWYGARRESWDSAIRVYDRDLNLVWQRTGLPNGKKDTLTYAHGKLVCGSGDHWGKKRVDDKWVPWDCYAQSDEWKRITAYAVGTGEVAWTCDLSAFAYDCIMNVPYSNGYFYAETQNYSDHGARLFRINAQSGVLEGVLQYDHEITSCAPCIIARGKLFSGDLGEDRIVATRIAENSKADWPGPFCDPQTNTYAAPDESEAIVLPMKEITIQ